MKLGNFVLILFSAAALYLAAATTIMTLSSSPTAVISVLGSSNEERFAIKLPSRLSPRQVEILTLAYEIARDDGHADPRLLQAIIMQESNAGDHHSYKVAGHEFGLRVNERYYGVAQIKLVAAKEVLRRYPSMRQEFGFHTTMDEEIIAKLIEDDRFNLTVASRLLLILHAHYGFKTSAEIALAYNQGPSGAQRHDSSTHHYSTGVMKHLQRLQQART